LEFHKDFNLTNDLRVFELQDLLLRVQKQQELQQIQQVVASWQSSTKSPRIQQ